MILYTMMPHELVFAESGNGALEEKMAIVNGVEMIVRPCEDHSFEVVRLLSSNPNHYLKSECMPGQKISSAMVVF
ncbi:MULTISPECIES: YlzJ-like family protein [Bacillaceae]|uniref:YlzJ-like family protein n=1 Tax=Metabacillus sediminis TaxID=3117746 RepID=A0ABZ2NMW9_9BACI|nr:YlzJ-like family protein [Bacillus sp. SJS]KZZ82795.1 ribonuclease [Bacillus sp. SJS]